MAQEGVYMILIHHIHLFFFLEFWRFAESQCDQMISISTVYIYIYT